MPIVAPNDSTLAMISSTGATIARSSSASTTKMTSRIAGMTFLRSASVTSRTSRLMAVEPPTRIVLGDLVEVRAQVAHRVGRRLRVGRIGQGREHHRLPVDDPGLAGVVGGRQREDRRLLLGRRPPGRRCPRVPRPARSSPPGAPRATTSCAGEALSASKCASSTSCAVDRLDVGQEQLGLRHLLLVELRDHRRRSGQDHEGHQPHDPRPALDEPGQPAPESLGVGVLGAVRRLPRPVRLAPEQHQRRRQQA